jgi:hypothetical protein
MEIDLQRRYLTLTFHQIFGFCNIQSFYHNSYRKNENIDSLCKFKNTATEDSELTSFSLKENNPILAINDIATGKPCIKVGKNLRNSVSKQTSNKKFKAFQYSKLSLCGIVIASYSNNKQFFPDRCKNIFVHFSEKTNLLLRLENKTGLYA